MFPAMRGRDLAHLPRTQERQVPRFVFILLLVDLVSLGLTMPVLPEFVVKLEGPGPVSLVWYGAATFAYAAGFFVSAGIVGRLSDALGRRRIMLAGCAGLALGNVLSAMGGDVWWLIGGRLVCGVCSINISLAPAYVADLSLEKDRGRLFGLLAAMQGLGFILGPVAGGFLAQIDLRLPFFAAAVCTTASGFAGLYFLGESLPSASRRPVALYELSPFQSLRQLAGLRGFGALIPAIALFSVAQNIGILAWVPYASARFGWDSAQNGIGLFVYGACILFSLGVFFPWVVRKFPIRKICIVSMVSSLTAYLAFGFAETGWIALVAMGGNVAGYCTLTAFQTLASGLAGERSQGEAMGGLQALNSLALVAAPVPTAALLYGMAHCTGGNWKSGVPMYACALLVAAALLLCMRGLRRLKAEKSR